MLTYEPLEHDDSFRLLRLLPGSITDPIRCSLETSRISRQHEKYLCLSYCWGEIKNLRPILCQGTKVFVTPTLFHALERLRLPHQVTTIWVDALCINQSREPAGLSERQEQVRLMSKIFGSAYCVIVDLGQHSDSWRWLVKLLPDFAGLNQETRHTSMIGPEPYGIPIARQRCNGEEEDHEAFDAMRDRVYIASASECLRGQRLSRLSTDLLALGPAEAAINDEVVVFDGVFVPYMLRGTQNNEFVLVGPCYVHDLMNGEALERPQFAVENFLIC